jgi:hypothetical protein
MEKLLSQVRFSLGLLSAAFVLASHCDAETKPKLIIESSVHNFGTVSQGEKIIHDFTVRNAGDAELVIQRIVPSCGCTATSSSADKIEPGASATIHVEVDTTGFSGDKLKTVRLFTNDPIDPSSMLTIRGVIQPDVNIEPAKLLFPDIVRGEATQAPYQDFTVRVRQGAKIKIESISSVAPFLTFKELDSTDSSRKVRVTLNRELAPGEYRDRVVVNLHGGLASAINVPVIATVKGKLQLKPSSLSFGIIEGKDVLVKTVKLENLGSDPITLKNLKSDNPAMSAGFEVVKPGKVFNIRIKVDPTKITSDLRASLTIETDSKDEGGLALPVYGILPPKL